MSLPPLITAQQLADRMGSAPDPTRVDAAIADASATVRAVSGQIFTRDTTTDSLRARCCGYVRLPQRPVNDVIDVYSPSGDPIDWGWDGLERVVVLWAYDVVLVSYDHGYDETPDDIVAVACNVAARTLAASPANAGITQRSITNYSESFGPVGAAGPAGLFNDEKAILLRYRRDGSSARLCTS